MMRGEFWNNISGMKKLYSDFLMPVCQTYGMTRMELDILLFLANNPCYDTAKDMIEQRKLAKSHVSASVNCLCKEGYLGKEYRDGNGKIVHLVLLPPSDGIVSAGRKAQRAFTERIFRGFTEQEIEQFDQMTRKISQNVCYNGHNEK